jgi:hypothetical protein
MSAIVFAGVTNASIEQLVKFFLRSWPWLTSIGLLGGLCFGVCDRILYPHTQSTGIPRWTEMASLPFFFLYLFATHILGPIRVFQMLEARDKVELERGTMENYPWWHWVLLLPLGLSTLGFNAKAPGFIAFPLIWALFVLCAWLTFVLSMVTIINL